MKRNCRQALALTLGLILLVSASFGLAGCQLRRDEAPLYPDITLYIPPSDEPIATEEPENASAPAPTAKPASAPVPTAAPTSTPEPEPEPDPTPDPARFINIATSKLIKITKHPAGETVRTRAKATFIAHADNAVSIEWRFVSPNYDREVLWNADNLQNEFPGLRCEDGDKDTFVLYNIPKELNGWYVVCLFTDQDGGMLASKGAKLSVIGYAQGGADPTPSAEPTDDPVPSGEPAVEPSVGPTSQPTAAPTSEPAGEPVNPPAEEPVVNPVPEPDTGDSE